MSFLGNLSIKIKIYLVALVGVLGFIGYFLFVMMSAVASQALLKNIQSSTFPALENAQKSILLHERIEEILITSVSTGDIDVYHQALSLRTTFSENLDELKILDPKLGPEVDAIKTKFALYSQSAFSLSEQMINGTVDFSKLGALANDKKSMYSALANELKDFQQRKYENFHNEVALVESSLADTISVGIVSGLGMITVMILVSTLVVFVIDRVVKNITFSLREIAQGDGDLTQRIKQSSNDELGTLVYWFNTFIEKLQQTIHEVVDVVSNLTDLVSELNSVSNKTKQMSEEQNSSSLQISEAMTEVFRATDYVSTSSVSTADAAMQAETKAKEGQEIVAATMQSINELAGEVETSTEVIGKLEKDTENVGSILSVIQSIAEQTNLLALNAAIEAARAGDQGRGFAVVADEVRTLASRTQEATHEIQAVIEKLQTAAQAAAKVMGQGNAKAASSVAQADETGRSLAAIIEKISLINDMTREIAGASEEQRAQTDNVTQNVKRMAELSEDAASGTVQVLKLSSELDQLAKQLQMSTSQFNV